MRDYEMARRRWARVLTIVAVAGAGVLLAMASPAAIARPAQAGSAAAGPNTDPVRFWSVSKVEQGIGKVQVSNGSQQGGFLHKDVDLGLAAFSEEPALPADRATASVLSTASGAQYHVLAEAPSLNPFVRHSPKGGVTHLDEYQAYEKRSGDASLRITISQVILDAIDDNGVAADQNGVSTLPGCPSVMLDKCKPVRAVVRFHARAYAASSGGDFFDVGGAAYIEGMYEGITRTRFVSGGWSFHAVTLSDSQVPLWTFRNFLLDSSFFDDPDELVSHSRAELNRAPSLKVPLASVRDGELFAVHVTMDAEAIDDRGHESAAEAFIKDPQRRDPPLLTARSLKQRGRPKFKEPSIRPRPAARCSAGAPRHPGTVQLSSSAFTVGEGSGAPMVLVMRKGGSRGATSVIVKTSGGSAQAGSDFRPTTTRVTFGRGDASPRLVEIPIREDLTRESPESFKVSLAHVRCSRLGKQRSAAVTILDDDQPPPPPPPEFKIGGTVDGLQGAGLVLSNLGDDVPVSANRSFTFPRTAVTGQPYEVAVRTQPHNPDQVCTVDHGTGHVVSANVTDIAVHCVTQVIPSGLDSTFGDHGRVTTPGSGEGRAVLIQPDGGIVTVGLVPKDQLFHFKFGAVRVDTAGRLDQGFGAGGLASTDLGGKDDKPSAAALMPDGGFVAAGQADPAGLANIDFGVARYTANGQPAPGFGGGSGFVTTDIAGHGDAANAVAVQPDGKIVAAGEAETRPGNFDFALVRYNPDGSLDTSFGVGGKVTTDFGALSDDDVRGLAIQSDGKIVVAGSADSTIGNAALARYLPDGSLDPTFGANGTALSDIGTDVVNGVAITPGGTILIAGTRGGPNGSDVIVASFAPNGVPNRGFGQGGVADADLSGHDDFGNDLVLDAHGNIVVVGTSGAPCASPDCSASPPPPAGPDMALVRFKPDGTLDTSFANRGILTADFHDAGDTGDALAIDSKGRIVAAGSTDNGSDTGFALMRANP